MHSPTLNTCWFKLSLHTAEEVSSSHTALQVSACRCQCCWCSFMQPRTIRNKQARKITLLVELSVISCQQKSHLQMKCRLTDCQTPSPFTLHSVQPGGGCIQTLQVSQCPSTPSQPFPSPSSGPSAAGEFFLLPSPKHPHLGPNVPLVLLLPAAGGEARACCRHTGPACTGHRAAVV